MKDLIIKFNDLFKIGDPVCYQDDDGTEKVGFTRWNAEMIPPENDKAGVWISGRINCVLLEKVKMEKVNLLPKKEDAAHE